MTAALDSRAMDAKKPYGNVTYADPGYQADKQKRYPLDTAEHCKAAWSYINMPKNAGMYSAEHLAEIKGRIKAAAKKYGIEISDTGRAAQPDLCERSFAFDAEPEGDGRTLEGYAAIFRTPTTIRDANGDFEEVILPGAFKRSLTERTPVLQWDHGRDPAVGTAPIGDITDLREDDRGLYVRARLYDHPSTERVRMAIKGRSIRGMSFRFGVPDKGDEWTRRDGKPDLREIREADVHELGPVVFPAYRTTTVSLRDLLTQLGEDGYRQLVRDVGDHLLAAADLTDLAGRPDARSAGGGDRDTGPGSGPGAQPDPETLRLDAEALRALGVL